MYDMKMPINFCILWKQEENFISLSELVFYGFLEFKFRRVLPTLTK